MVSSFSKPAVSTASDAATGGETSAQTLLQFNEVGFGYGARPTIDKLSLAVSAGELVVITGPNGGGKTTLLNLACGLLRPTRGAVEIAGRDARAMPRAEIARAVALAPQYLPYTPWLSVRNVVELARYAVGADDAAVARAMSRVGVAHLAYRLCGELSGGELRRVHLARAIAQDARLLLLDEPTGDLDLQHIGGLLSLVNEIVESGRAVIVVTHDINFAIALGGRTIALKDGSIVFDGAVGDFSSEKVLSSLYAGGYSVIQTDVGIRAIVPSSGGMQAGTGEIEGQTK